MDASPSRSERLCAPRRGYRPHEQASDFGAGVRALNGGKWVVAAIITNSLAKRVDLDPRSLQPLTPYKKATVDSGSDSPADPGDEHLAPGH